MTAGCSICFARSERVRRLRAARRRSQFHAVPSTPPGITASAAKFSLCLYRSWVVRRVRDGSAGAVTLTVYSAQHEQTVDLLTKAFTKETGIDVKVRNGEAPELASELVKEGASSPADVFFTENSPELELLSEKGLLAKVAPATLASVPAEDSGSERRLGRRSRARERAGLQQGHDQGRGPARVAPRSRQARMEGQGRDRPDRRGFPAAGRRRRRAQGTPGRAGMAEGPAGERGDLRRRRGRRRGGRARRLGDRDHQQLLLGAAAHGDGRRQDEERHPSFRRRRRRRP